MRSFICGLALTLLLPAIAVAQQIVGVVVEDSTNLPIPDATIELLAADGTVRAMSRTGATGWFDLRSESGGQFVLRASHVAYRIFATLTGTLDANETVTVVLRLSGGPIPLEPVIARGTARDPLSGYRERARRGAFGRFITRDDIDKFGGYTISQALRLTPEVRIEGVRDGPFTTQGVFMRTYGELCVPTVFLDGMPMPTGSGFDIDELLSGEEVEGIEVYRSSLTAPLQFRLPAFGAWDESCGVIVVWSRTLPRAALSLKRIFFTGLLVTVPMLLMSILQDL